MECTKIEDSYDDYNRQYVLIFTLDSAYNAENMAIKLQFKLRGRFGFTVDVKSYMNKLNVKFSDANLKNAIRDFIVKNIT